MLEELLKQIGEVVEGDGADKSGKDPSVNIIIGNSGTVVIGDGSKGSNSGDRDQESSDDSQASKRAILREISKLRSQVRQLIRVVRKLFLKTQHTGFKDWQQAKQGRLKTDGTKFNFPAFVSKRLQFSSPPFFPLNPAPFLASSQFISFHPILSRMSQDYWLHTFVALPETRGLAPEQKRPIRTFK